jgi:uncharacterized membrane-anchored protein YitT (DUF2179 family)
MYKNRTAFYQNHYRTGKMPILWSGFCIFFGSILVAIALQFFLVKNHIIDGGIVGIAILISNIYELNLGFLLIILNLPFLLIGSIYLGFRFLMLSLYASITLAIGTSVLEPFPAITNDPALVILLGGFLLGLGVGIIIRFGGSLDGTEVLAIILMKKWPFSIGQSVMIFNFFVFSSAIFVFGMKESLYSLATFFIAYRTIDFTLD